jgi:hypothetical protein
MKGIRIIFLGLPGLVEYYSVGNERLVLHLKKGNGSMVLKNAH